MSSRQSLFRGQPQRNNRDSLLPTGVKRARSPRLHSRKTRALATVECVVCLPILISITFATIDLCSAMFLKETLTIAAYEGSRIGIQKGGTNAQVTAQIQSVLDARGVTYDGSSVAISTPGFESAGTLEHVTVTVQVPCAGNLPMTGNLFNGSSISTSITLRKEFANL
ncbi:MAG: TadE/TadG family type IV pilus assembly protein [Aureliella sp.]